MVPAQTLAVVTHATHTDDLVVTYTVKGAEGQTLFTASFLIQINICEGFNAFDASQVFIGSLKQTFID